jgi:hypothetical protein
MPAFSPEGVYVGLARLSKIPMTVQWTVTVGRLCSGNWFVSCGLATECLNMNYACFGLRNFTQLHFRALVDGELSWIWRMFVIILEIWVCSVSYLIRPPPSPLWLYVRCACALLLLHFNELVVPEICVTALQSQSAPFYIKQAVIREVASD